MAQTAVQEKKQTAPAIMADLEAHAGAGMDQISTDQMQIPFLRVAQQMSRALNKQEPDYIKGMSAGDIFNNVTSEYWDSDEGVVVLPVGFSVKYLEYKPKLPDGTGGGFIRELQASDPDIAKTNREGATEILPNGNELVRSNQHLVMLVNEENGTTQPVIIDFKKTGIKVSKRWNTMMKMVQYQGAKGPFTAPMWATVWRLKSAQESNNLGSWFNFIMERMEPTEIPATALEASKEMFAKFQSGEVKTQVVPTEEMEVANASPESDDIPF